MKQFLIVTNRNKDKELETAKWIQNYLQTHGAECTIDVGSKTKEKDIPMPHWYLRVPSALLYLVEMVRCCRQRLI